VEGRAAPGAAEPAAVPLGDFHAATDRFQRSLIEAALREANGRHGRAAARLGLSRHALRHQMQKLGVIAAP
jgi:DNA-binding NtrC family response regulator